MSRIVKIRVPQEVITYKDDPNWPEAAKIYATGIQIGENLLNVDSAFCILPSTRGEDGNYLYDIELLTTDGEEVNSFVIESSDIPQPPPKRFVKEGSSAGF